MTSAAGACPFGIDDVTPQWLDGGAGYTRQPVRAEQIAQDTGSRHFCIDSTLDRK